MMHHRSYLLTRPSFPSLLIVNCRTFKIVSAVFLATENQNKQIMSIASYLVISCLLEHPFVIRLKLSHSICQIVKKIDPNTALMHSGHFLHTPRGRSAWCPI